MMKWLPYPRLDILKAGGRQQRPTLSLQAFESDRILTSAQARDVVVQSPSHVQLFVTPMDCSGPGFPVPHYPLEFAQVHVH